MYSKYRPLLPQIASKTNTQKEHAYTRRASLELRFWKLVQFALVGAFILQTSFDKRTRVLLFHTHDVSHAIRAGMHSCACKYTKLFLSSITYANYFSSSPLCSPSGEKVIIRCSLFINQYGPYWSVIWPILVSNMTHITLLFGCYGGLGNKKPFPRMGKVMVRFASANDAAGGSTGSRAPA